jgi:hypothetical protein
VCVWRGWGPQCSAQAVPIHTGEGAGATEAMPSDGAICMGEDGAARATPVRRHRFTKGVIGRLLLLVHGPSHAGMK